MKYQEQCEIVEKIIDHSYLFLKFRTKNIAKNALAGQFVNIRVNNSFTPLLRRPFSITDTEGDTLSLLILLKGKGTEALFGKKIGDFLDIIGPLGNSFPLINRRAIFVAGGVGIAPFFFLSKTISSGLLLFGVKSKEYLPELSAYSSSFSEVKIASEDGSSGKKGTVIDLLSEYDLSDKVVYACGPNPMLRAVSKILRDCAQVEAYYSIETIMGCGFGVCKGCAVETPSGQYKLACTDGPIFSWNEVKL